MRSVPVKAFRQYNEFCALRDRLSDHLSCFRQILALGLLFILIEGKGTADTIIWHNPTRSFIAFTAALPAILLVIMHISIRIRGSNKQWRKGN